MIPLQIAFRRSPLRRTLLACLSLLGAAATLPGEPAVAAAGAGKTTDAGWQNLFDGKSLAGWKQSGFEAEGTVKLDRAFRGAGPAIILESGLTLSGITWLEGAALPRVNYEISLEAMRVDGSDFFCGLTFPVGKSACSFIVGGWGGMVVGISSVDYADASENDTTTGMTFADKRWYRIRVRVTDEKIEAWIDNQQMVDLEYKERKISLRPGEIDKSLPLGIASYQTRAALREIKLRRL